jgi:hypothetical protein
VSVLQRQAQNIGLVRHRDKVYMVGHQAVAKQVYTVQGYALQQQIQVDAPIGIAAKDELPCIPPLGNVIRYTDCDHPRQTRHASHLIAGVTLRRYRQTSEEPR